MIRTTDLMGTTLDTYFVVGLTISTARFEELWQSGNIVIISTFLIQISLPLLFQKADNVAEGQRASAFGILSGVSSASFVFGTLTARFLSTSSTFQVLLLLLLLLLVVVLVLLLLLLLLLLLIFFELQVAASAAVISAVYMRAFLPDSNICSCSSGNSSWPTTSKRKPMVLLEAEPSQKNQIFSRIPSVEDMTCLLRSRLVWYYLTRLAWMAEAIRLCTLFHGCFVHHLYSDVL